MRSTRSFAHSSTRLSLPLLAFALLAPHAAHAADKKQEAPHDTLASTTSTTPPAVSSTATTSAVSSTATTSEMANASPEDDPAIKVSALLGYSTNDLNFGVGARVGTNRFFPHVYVGGTFVYQIGHSVSESVGGTSASASISAFYLGPEVGYDLYFAPVVLRLYAGVGIAGLTASSSVNGNSVGSETSTRFVLWPGAQAIYDLPESRFFVAADTRFLTIPGGPAVGFFAMGGTRF